MKKNVVWMVLLMGGLILALVLRSGSDEGASQSTLMEEAKARAIAENKPILLDFSTKWCQPCQVFDKQRQVDSELLAALEQVILLQIDCEHKGKKLAQDYMIDSYPTFILMNADGNVHGLWKGYRKNLFLDAFNGYMGELKQATTAKL